MSNTQILMTVLLIILFIQFVRKIIYLRKQFYPLYNHAMEYILKADRNNPDQCIKAVIIVELVRRYAFGRKRKIDYRQLKQILYFKFSDLLPMDYL